MENEKSIVMLSDFQEDFNYLSLFPKSMLVIDLLKEMGLTRLFFKVIVKH